MKRYFSSVYNLVGMYGALGLSNQGSSGESAIVREGRNLTNRARVQRGEIKRKKPDPAGESEVSEL